MKRAQPPYPGMGSTREVWPELAWRERRGEPTREIEGWQEVCYNATR